MKAPSGAWATLVGWLLIGWGGAEASTVAAEAAQATAEERTPTEGLAVVAGLVPTFDGEGRVLALLVDLPNAAATEDDPQADSTGELQIRLIDGAARELVRVVRPIELVGQGVQVYSAHRAPDAPFTAEVRFLGVEGTWRGAWSERFPAWNEGADPAWASAPLLVASRSGWRALRLGGEEEEELPYPFVGSDQSVFLPIAERQVGAGESVVVSALVASRRGGFPFLRARWTAEGGQGSFERNVEILSVGTSPLRGLWLVQGRIGAAEAAGRYGVRLAFVAADGSLGALSPGGVRIQVVGAPRGPAADSGAVAAALSQPGATVGGALEASFVAVLRTLVQSGFEGATTLYAETAGLAVRSGDGRPSNRRLEELTAAMIAVGERLVDREPRAALPIAALHAMAHRRFLDRHDARLMSAASSCAAAVLERGRAVGDADAKAWSADVLSLVDPRAALELDADHALALLRVAIGNPLVPASEGSIVPLRRLVGAQPADGHARLRLGVALRRAGELDAAARELAQAAGGEGTGWWREVAFGELAALEWSRGRRREAEEALRRGIAETEAPQLHLQLGAYLDEWNRTQEAVSIVNRMPVTRAGELESGRHRMKRGAESEIAAAIAKMEERATRRLDALATALGASGFEGRGAP